MSMRGQIETMQHEGFKNAAAFALDTLSKTQLGCQAIERYGWGGTPVGDERLKVTVEGIDFTNPLIVGAGWDKTGKAAQGLHLLGFAGVEVGTVTAWPQPGNPQPRLWTIDKDHSVGLNRLGYNSPGAEEVADNLKNRAPFNFPLRINVGINKIAAVETDIAATLHAIALRPLLSFARWVTLGVSSPNTQDLRKLQDPDVLGDIIYKVQTAMDVAGVNRPLFIKIAPDLSSLAVRDLVDVAIDTECMGIVAVNTTTDKTLKAKYGERWTNEPGGLSGADPQYEEQANRIIRDIYDRAGDKLTIMGAGGVHDADSVIRKLQAGAQLVQLVTAIRPSRGRVAGMTCRGLLERMNEDGVSHIHDYVGTSTARGSLPRPS